MSPLHIIAYGATFIISLSFSGLILLGIPHKCPKHGWNTRSICLQCECDQDRYKFLLSNDTSQDRIDRMDGMNGGGCMMK